MNKRRQELYQAISELITQLGNGAQDSAKRDQLLKELRIWQAQHIVPFRNLSETLHENAALPTEAFRHSRIANFALEEELRCFQSSGTTGSLRSRHAFRDLSLYDQAAKAAARYALFPNCKRMPLLMLAPHESEAPDSSLSYMLSRFAEWFGTHTTWAWQDNQLQLPLLSEALSTSNGNHEAIAILGTSFAMVHLLDALKHERFSLPPGSRIMQTGGYKGRSRTVAPLELRAELSQCLGIPEDMIISEYGMTELSSQLYETTLRESVIGESKKGAAIERSYWIPGWIRLSIVDPLSFEPLPAGETGLIRIEDLANLDSVCSILTNDLGRMDQKGLVLLGRSEQSVERGCSITADVALSSS